MSDPNELPAGMLNFAPKIEIKAFGTYIGPREKLLQQLADIQADPNLPERSERIAELELRLAELTD